MGKSSYTITMPDQLGKRIALCRAALGMTQQELADRIAVSRVAISHLEMGLQVPSERTIALLAGVFGCEPHQLVANTYYPPAKADRLPPVVARYTEIDKELLLLKRDLHWIDRVAALPQSRVIVHETLHGWLDRLAPLIDDAPDKRSRAQLCEAQERVQQMLRDREPGAGN